MLLKGVTEHFFLGIIVLIIALFGLAAVLQVQNPFESSEVRALRLAVDLPSYLNALTLEDAGSVTIELGEEFDVQVVFDDTYYVQVRPVGGEDFEEGEILFYPATLDESLVKEFHGVEKVCVIKQESRAYAEVAVC